MEYKLGLMVDGRQKLFHWKMTEQNGEKWECMTKVGV